VDGLAGELRQWEGVSRSGGPLEKHRSQVDAVLALLGVGLADARARLTDGRGDEVPGRILDLHHVWDFFRSRLMLRRVRDLRRLLDVADELAWQCYGPVLALPGTHPKEPPLVGFGRTASPRAHRRGSAYHDLLPRGGIHTREGREAAARLPFPVIEVPWHFGAQLPALLTVAHETAHHIEDDCDLGDEIRRRVEHADLPPERAVHWARWAGEAFADVCAAVVCGTAYAEVLAELLEPELPADEADFAGPHPPPGARVRLARAAARAAGHPVDDPGADDPDQGDPGRKDSGREAPDGGEPGHEDSDREQSDRQDPDGGDPGREHLGREYLSGEDFGCEDFGCEDLDGRDSGREDLRHEDSGREDADCGDLGREDPGGKDPDRETAAVAAALLHGGYEGLGGRRLTELLTPADAAEVPAGARKLLRGRPSGCRSAATVLAAAALAFQGDPVAYDGQGVAERAVTEVLRLRAAGSRAVPDPDPADDAERRRRYAEAGALLLSALDATPVQGPSRPVST
jgi:hypothetical protein